MASSSTIEWTESTWSPVTGCSVLSPGCKKCYAMRLAGGRLKHHPSREGLTTPTKNGPVWTGEVRFNEQWLYQPDQWKKPRRIFVAAHSDLFHESVPDKWIDRIFAVMFNNDRHIFQVLTKRAERMHAYMTDPETPERIRTVFVEYVRQYVRDSDVPIKEDPNAWVATIDWPVKNVWVGVSVENQETANERIPFLLRTIICCPMGISRAMA